MQPFDHEEPVDGRKQRSDSHSSISPGDNTSATGHLTMPRDSGRHLSGLQRLANAGHSARTSIMSTSTLKQD